MTMTTAADQERTFRVLARVAAPALILHHADRRAGGMHAGYLPRQIDPQEAASLPLPQLDRDEKVLLIDGLDFQREARPMERGGAYERRARTRVIEHADARADGWHGLVAAQLTALTNLRVVSTLYQSNRGDSRLGPHVDEWNGLVLQLRGAKVWSTWPTPHGLETFRTEPGDVLTLPRGLLHDVETPEQSTHILFAFTGPYSTD